jgi:nicotinamide riboside transporter PnuC
MIWKLAAYTAVALSLAGNVGVVQRRRWGMTVWIFANVIWVTYHFQREDWPSVMLFSAYLGLAVWGFMRWKKA